MSNKEIENKIWSLLADVPDPEIPVLSILDLGVVRKIEINKDASIMFKIIVIALLGLALYFPINLILENLDVFINYVENVSV